MNFSAGEDWRQQGIEVQDIPGRHRDKLWKDEVKKVM
jgi:hypothetical protein